MTLRIQLFLYNVGCYCYFYVTIIFIVMFIILMPCFSLFYVIFASFSVVFTTYLRRFCIIFGKILRYFYVNFLWFLSKFKFSLFMFFFFPALCNLARSAALAQLRAYELSNRLGPGGFPLNFRGWLSPNSTFPIQGWLLFYVIFIYYVYYINAFLCYFLRHFPSFLRCFYVVFAPFLHHI